MVGEEELQISKEFSRQCVVTSIIRLRQRDSLFIAFDSKERVVAFDLNEKAERVFTTSIYK